MTMDSFTYPYPNIVFTAPIINRPPSRAEENIQRLVAQFRQAETACRNIIAAGRLDGQANLALQDCAARALEAGAHAERALGEQAKFDVQSVFETVRREATDG